MRGILTSDADYATIAGPAANGGLGWSPLSTFTGTFDGGGFTIDGLNSIRPVGSYVGLFGRTSGATVSNVRMTNAVIDGSGYGGILIGSAESGSDVSDCVVSGAVSGGGAGRTGGMIGAMGDSTITKCSADVVVEGSTYVGGLIGHASNGQKTASELKSTGSVTGVNSVGGLIGEQDSYFYAYYNDCYSTCSVTSTGSKAGGLFGRGKAANVNRSYSAGAVSGVSSVGGLIGTDGLGTDCFWDTETSGQATSSGGAGVVGKTTAEMQTESTFTGAGWDFTTVWVMDGYPELQWAVSGPDLELLESFHDGSNGYKVEYNITDGAYRVTHGSENVEFSYVRTGDYARSCEYNASTKLLEFYINESLVGSHTFTNALVMPVTGSYTIEGERIVDEFSYKEGPTDITDIATYSAYFG